METTAAPGRDVVLEALERVLASSAFRGAERSSAMLRYLVEQTLDGRPERLKEYTVGVEALGRGEAFDPRTDPIVRAEASRLRGRLERYYAGDGATDPTIIVLPKGSYVPVFEPRSPAAVVAAAAVDDTAATSETAPSPRHRGWWLASVALVGAVAFVAGRWAGDRDDATAASAPTVRLDVALTDDASTLGSEVGTDIVISRDGRRIAFISTGRDGVSRLSMRALEDSSAITLPGTQGARGPFFSPDGRWVGFWADRKLKKVAVDGGSPVVLCDASDLLGASWGDDDVIIANLDGSNALWRVAGAGGTPTRVLALSQPGVTPRWPQILPGGTDVLYTAVPSVVADRATIEVASLRTGERRTVVHGGTFGRYLASGTIAYVNQGTLYVAPYDLARADTLVRARPVLNGISYSPTFGYAQIDFSRTGTVVYRRSAGPSAAVWLDSTGTSRPFVETSGPYAWPRLSPDGRRLAVSTVDAGIATVALFGWDPALGRATRVPISVPQALSVMWTPDGRFMIATGAAGLAWMREGEAPTSLMRDTGVDVAWSFTPNGDRLAYHHLGRDTRFDIWTVPIRSDAAGLHAGPPEPFLQTKSFEVYPAFSPDGQWLAYSSNESGSWEVYVRHFPDDGRPEVHVSPTGGRVPKWSPNGHDLFYGTDDHRLMVVRWAVRGGSFVADPPRQWTSRNLADTGVFPNFDVGPDGRVLALIPVRSLSHSNAENQATVIFGFFGQIARQR